MISGTLTSDEDESSQIIAGMFGRCIQPLSHLDTPGQAFTDIGIFSHVCVLVL